MNNTIALLLILALTAAQGLAGDARQGSKDYWPDQGQRGLWSAGSECPTNMPVTAKAEADLSFVGTAMWTASSDMKIVGDALIVYTMNGLQTFNIADLNEIVLVDQVPMNVCGSYSTMDIGGNYLYVGAADRLVSFDISDPFHPIKLDELLLEGMAWQVTVVGDIVYVGIGRYRNEPAVGSGLFIINIVDPANLEIVSAYQPNGTYTDCRRFAFYGDYLYTINPFGGQVEIINVSDVTKPMFVNAMGMQPPYDIAIENGVLYVDEGYNMLRIYNLANPASPALLNIAAIDRCQILRFHEGNLYTGFASPDGRADSVRIWDVSQPGQITRVGAAHLRMLDWQLDFSGDRMLVPEAIGGFSILDVVNPAVPSTLLIHEYDNYDLRGIAIGGSHAYLTNYTNWAGLPSRNGVNTVDYSDRQHPQHVSRNGLSGGPENPLVQNSLLYVNGGQPTYIYSLANPALPQLISQWPSPWGYTMHSSVSGSILYATGESWLRTVLLGDFTNPMVLDTLLELTGIYPAATLVDQNVLYVAGFDTDPSPNPQSWIASCDISNPFQMRLLSLLDLGDCRDWTTGMMVKWGKYIYLANTECGVSVIDVGNPVVPRFLGHASTGDEDCYDVKIKDNYLVAACQASLQIFRLNDPAAPTLVRYIPMSSYPQQMAIEGDYLHVVCRWGYYIFKFNLPPFLCGDVDANGTVNISDAVALIKYVFGGGIAPNPLGAGDVNCSGGISISDAVYLISFIFSGGAAPCAACP